MLGIRPAENHIKIILRFNAGPPGPIRMPGKQTGHVFHLMKSRQPAMLFPVIESPPLSHQNRHSALGGRSSDLSENVIDSFITGFSGRLRIHNQIVGMRCIGTQRIGESVLSQRYAKSTLHTHIAKIVVLQKKYLSAGSAANGIAHLLVKIRKLILFERTDLRLRPGQY